MFIVKVDALSENISFASYRQQGAVQTLPSTVTEVGVTLRRKVHCRNMTQFGLPVVVRVRPPTVYVVRAVSHKPASFVGCYGYPNSGR